MQLFICEKKLQAEDLARSLGKVKQGDAYLEVNGGDIIVCWAQGHLLEQANPEDYDEAYKEWHVDLLPIVPTAWKLNPLKDKMYLLRSIQGQLKRCKEVIIATDAGREGELIAREILIFSGYKGPIRRLWVSSLDEASLKKGLANLLPGSEKEGLYRSAVCRARADWLYGINLTRAFSLLISPKFKIPYKEGQKPQKTKPFGVGRVKTPTLSIVVARDTAIESFVPHDTYKVDALMRKGDAAFNARWLAPESVKMDDAGNCIDQAAASSCSSRVAGKEGCIISAETTTKRANQPLGYSLDVLQTECGKRFGFRAKQVLEIAQSLYEKHKILSYPRTDCAHLPTSMLPDAAASLAAISVVSELAGLASKANIAIRSPIWNDKKVAETDHHCIIPTTKKPNPSALSPEELKVYELVARRFIAQFYPAHEFDQTTVNIKVGDDDFRASGKVIRNQGWKSVYGNMESLEKEKDPADTLPKMAQGDVVKVESAKCTTGKTTPPERYTEGTLIEAMKKASRFVTDERLRQILRDTSGIGAQSTRTNIIEELISQELIDREVEGRGKKKKEYLISSARGRALIAQVPPMLKNPGVTGIWEQYLEDIAHGKGSAGDFMAKQTDFVRRTIDELRGKIPVTARKTDEETTDCPACNKKDSAVRLYSPKKQNYFWVCGIAKCGQFFEDKNGELDLEKFREQKNALDSAETCPICKKGKLRARTGSKGVFWSCSNYPACTGNAPDDNGAPDLSRARESTPKPK